MPTRPAIARPLRLAILAGLAALASYPAAAHEQVFYKSRLPSGAVVYSDQPVAGAVSVEKVTVPLPPAPPPAAETAGARQELLDAAAAKSRALEAADQEIRAAYRALDEAKAAREAGVEPLPGEVLGTAIPGRRRLSEAYWDRQRQLDDVVRQAEARLDAALERRNALR